MRRRALTLVEIGATVAVLCCALAMIVPALGETRRRGKDTVCLQNLHRIIQASLVFSGQDPTEAAIPVSHIEDGNDPTGSTSFYSQLPVYAYGGKSGLGNHLGNLNIATSLFGPATGLSAIDRPLNHILFRRPIVRVNPRPGAGGTKWLPDANLALDVYSCPADSGYTGLHINDGWRLSQATSFTHFGTSYAANVFWFNYFAGGSQAVLASNSPYLHPLSRVPNPARTIGYMENNGRSAWRVAPERCTLVTGLDGTCHGWHGKDWTFNTAFMDGSVNAIHMRGYRDEPISHPPLPGALFCISVRGDGWQIDTLPSAPVITSHISPDSSDRVP